MTQDERWYVQWKEIMDFMDANKRRPSKFVDEERGMRNWWKHQQKLLNAGELKPGQGGDVSAAGGDGGEVQKGESVGVR